MPPGRAHERLKLIALVGYQTFITRLIGYKKWSLNSATYAYHGDFSLAAA